MIYWGHKDGERIQTLKEHLEHTGQIAGDFADRFGKRDWGYCAGKLHDIGKYCPEFQEKIREGSNRKVDHASAGAKVCREKDGLYGFLSYAIAGHHAGLANTDRFDEKGGLTPLMERVKRKVGDYQAYQEEIQIPELTTPPFDAEKTSNGYFSCSVFIRMIYSCLVDADFLDTERFMKDGQVARVPGESPAVLLSKMEAYAAKWLGPQEPDTVNGRRTEILRHCIDCGKMARGLFRLTVPTGGGKTIASLAFALRHAVENHMDRVIYVIPYTSIIEQNAQVFRDILGAENVLEHHCNVDYESSEELKPMHLATENWDKPVVVTTNVQFFESLFSNKSSKCRKLHNIANSVIIFDEAQMLPIDYLKPCVAMIEELVGQYRSSAVLCTATQPALDPLFQSGLRAVELCPRMEEQFRFFERVRYQDMGIVSEEDLAGWLAQEEQALCVVNTRKRAQTLYQKLKGEGVYHLSTAMYPRHRQRVLEEIRGRLKNGEKCVLISTSLVEAGVDLDFQAVYRQMAGVDSIIQAAGRCNREGRRNREESVVHIFRFEEKEYVPGQRQQMDVTQVMLAENWEISSPEGILEYFKRLYHHRGEAALDSKRIMGEFQGKRYNFATVGTKFRLIEENTVTVVIPREDEPKALLQQIKERGYTKSGMRAIGPYCIQLRANDFDKLNAAGMVRAVSEDMRDFFELVNEDSYTEEMGLDLGVELGIAVMM